MRRILATGIGMQLCLGAVVLSGCSGLLDSMNATEAAVALMLHVEAQDNPLKPGDASARIPEATAFSLCFGQIDRAKLQQATDGKQLAQDGAWTGIKDAVVKLDFTDAAGTAQQITIPTAASEANALNLPVSFKGDGFYGISSKEAQLLSYNPASDYTVTVSWSGKQYQLKTRPAQPVKIKEFEDHGSKMWAPYPAGQAFTVTRDPSTDNPVQDNPEAFVLLSETKADGSTSLAYTNAPQTPQAFTNLMLDDTAYRANSFTIPGDKIVAGRGYAVTITAVAKGFPVEGSANTALFTGSQFLAGTADAGGLKAE